MARRILKHERVAGKLIKTSGGGRRRRAGCSHGEVSLAERARDATIRNLTQRAAESKTEVFSHYGGEVHTDSEAQDAARLPETLARTSGENELSPCL